MPSLDLVNVCKAYGHTPVLEGISLQVQPGEFIAFLGPSGCGKSTLLRMIAGLESVDEGEIWIDGERIDRRQPGERGVAMVFQHYALYPHMSARENIAFGLRNVGVKADEIARHLGDAAKILELEPLLDKKPGQLSGGQRQRVAIARAIVKHPKIFLFDEPLSNLDAALRMRTRLELAQLRRRVTATMILVTHDQVEAMTLADRIVVLHDRKIQQVGAPMEIYARPANTFVAGFVGAPSMTFIPVELRPPVARGLAFVTLPDGSSVQTSVATQGLPAGPLRLGVRAENVRVGPQGGPGSIPAEVEFVERLGERTLVYSRLRDGSALVGEDAGASRVRMGDQVGLVLDASAVHLFDADGKGHHPPGPAQ